jgi:hypothetical protein
VLGVAPDWVLDECWVDYVDWSGVEHHDPLHLVATMAFEQAKPVRQFPSYRGQRSFPGLWWSATTATHVGYESWLERDWLMAFDSSSDVTGIASQPFWLSWRTGSAVTRHAPDFFLRCADGGVVVVDIRADARIDADDRAVFESTEAVCASVGWGYRRLGEMPRVRAANLRWLAGYRHSRCQRPSVAARLIEVFARQRALLDGVQRVGDTVEVLPVLFHLLWHQELHVDLDVAPLCPDTIIGGAVA